MGMRWKGTLTCDGRRKVKGDDGEVVQRCAATLDVEMEWQPPVVVHRGRAAGIQGGSLPPMLATDIEKHGWLVRQPSKLLTPTAPKRSLMFCPRCIQLLATMAKDSLIPDGDGDEA